MGTMCISSAVVSTEIVAREDVLFMQIRIHKCIRPGVHTNLKRVQLHSKTFPICWYNHSLFYNRLTPSGNRLFFLARNMKEHVILFCHVFIYFRTYL